MTESHATVDDIRDYAFRGQELLEFRIALWQIIAGALAIVVYGISMFLPVYSGRTPAVKAGGWELTSASLDAFKAILAGRSIDDPAMLAPAVLNLLFVGSAFFWIIAVALRRTGYWPLLFSAQIARVGVCLVIVAVAGLLVMIAWQNSVMRASLSVSIGAATSILAFVLLWASGAEVVCHREMRRAGDD